MAQGDALDVHQLKITLRDTEVWRRLQVPSAITLFHLHDAIQAAMGWENRHLHDFDPDRFDLEAVNEALLHAALH